MIRLALVGFGRWGRNYVKAAHDSGVAQVTHAVLRKDSPSRPPAIGAGLKAVDRLDDVDVDAAVVAIHPKLAPWVCQAVMRRGLPVMVEKPAALSIGEAEALVNAEVTSGQFVLVNHQHLFAEGYEALRAKGTPSRADALFTGPVGRDYSPTWDYGPHAVACLLGLGADPMRSIWAGRTDERRAALVDAWHGGKVSRYDGYAPAEPPLTRSVRAFANAVHNGGTDDYRFGARWAVDVARILETVAVTMH